MCCPSAGGGRRYDGGDAGQPHRVADRGDLAKLVVVPSSRASGARLDLRIGQRLVDRAHPAARHAAALRARSRNSSTDHAVRSRFDDGDELGAVREAARCCRRTADRRADRAVRSPRRTARHSLRIAGAHHDHPVASPGTSRTARSTGAGCPCVRRLLPGGEEDARRQRHGRQHRVEERDVDGLAAAGAIAFAQRQQDAGEHELPGEDSRSWRRRRATASPSAGPVISIRPASAWSTGS